MHGVWYKAEKSPVFEKKSRIAYTFFVTKATYPKKPLEKWIKKHLLHFDICLKILFSFY